MTFTLDKYMPYTVGLDRFFNVLDMSLESREKGFPHYNIVKLGETKWIIELAVAGFDKKDINIELNQWVLNIKGTSESKHLDDSIIHKGISNRHFHKQFPLAEYIEPTKAEFENGILSITLEQNVPEDKKPKQIKIK